MDVVELVVLRTVAETTMDEVPSIKLPDISDDDALFISSADWSMKKGNEEFPFTYILASASGAPARVSIKSPGETT